MMRSNRILSTPPLQDDPTKMAMRARYQTRSADQLSPGHEVSTLSLHSPVGFKRLTTDLYIPRGFPRARFEQHPPKRGRNVTVGGDVFLRCNVCA